MVVGITLDSYSANRLFIYLVAMDALEVKHKMFNLFVPDCEILVFSISPNLKTAPNSLASLQKSLQVCGCNHYNMPHARKYNIVHLPYLTS